MSTNFEVLSDSEESVDSVDPIYVTLDSSQGEHITLTLKKQYETEDSVTSLYERHYMLSEEGNFSMYVSHFMSLSKWCFNRSYRLNCPSKISINLMYH